MFAVNRQDKVPEEFFCPISQQIMFDPVIACDGHVFERDSIEKWLQTKNTSPLTNLVLENKKLTPVYVIKNFITKFLDEHPEHKSQQYFPFSQYLQSVAQFVSFVTQNEQNIVKMKEYLKQNLEDRKQIDKWVSSAVKYGNIIEEHLSIFFQCGANPNQIISEVSYINGDKNIPIILLLIYFKQCNLVKEMIEKWNANIHAKSNHSSILHWAVGFSDNLSFVQYLVGEKHISINVKDSDGDTPVNWAAAKPHLQNTSILNYLLSFPEAICDYQNVNGVTPLHYTLQQHCWEQANILLDKKVRTNLRDNYSQHDACTLLISTFKYTTIEHEKHVTQQIALLRKIINNGYNILENSTNETIPSVEKMVKQIRDKEVRLLVMDALLFPQSKPTKHSEYSPAIGLQRSSGGKLEFEKLFG